MYIRNSCITTFALSLLIGFNASAMAPRKQISLEKAVEYAKTVILIKQPQGGYVEHIKQGLENALVDALTREAAKTDELTLAEDKAKEIIVDLMLQCGLDASNIINNVFSQPAEAVVNGKDEDARGNARGDNTATRDTQGDSCGICQSDLYDNGHDVVSLACDGEHYHSFHANCLHEWDKSRRGNAQCPICRVSLRSRRPSDSPRLYESIAHGRPHGRHDHDCRFGDWCPINYKWRVGVLRKRKGWR